MKGSVWFAFTLSRFVYESNRFILLANLLKSGNFCSAKLVAEVSAVRIFFVFMIYLSLICSFTNHLLHSSLLISLVSTCFFFLTLSLELTVFLLL